MFPLKVDGLHSKTEKVEEIESFPFQGNQEIHPRQTSDGSPLHKEHPDLIWGAA